MTERTPFDAEAAKQVPGEANAPSPPAAGGRTPSAERERVRLERDVQVLTQRAERAETMGQRLRDELTRMRREVAFDRRARDEEHAKVTGRADRAEDFNRSLIESRDREMAEATKQIDEARDRAERAEDYSRALLASQDDGQKREDDLCQLLVAREREVAGAVAHAAEVEDRAKRAEEYCAALLAEREAGRKTEADLAFIVGEREREIDSLKRELEAHQARAARAEEYSNALAAELEKARRELTARDA